MLFTVLSCKAQTKDNTKLSKGDYEVLSEFLLQFDVWKDYFLNEKIVFSKGNSEKFINKYNYQQNFYESMKYACHNSKDTLFLKTACPLADALKPYINLYTEKDFDEIKKSVKNRNTPFKINLAELGRQKNIKKHSNQYYLKSKDDLNEFPSIQLNGIYYNKDKNAVTIAYQIINKGLNDNSERFFLLIKKDNVWWKPLGNLKF